MLTKDELRAAQKAGLTNFKEGYREKEPLTYTQEMVIKIRDEAVDTFRKRVVEELEKSHRELGSGTYCLFCKQHIASGDCDCSGYNKGLDEAIKRVRETEK